MNKKTFLYCKDLALLTIDQHIDIDKLEKELHGRTKSNSSVLNAELDLNKTWTDAYLKDYIQLHGQVTGCNFQQSYNSLLVNQLHHYTSTDFHVCLQDYQFSLISLLLKNIFTYSTLSDACGAIFSNINNFQHCLPLTVLHNLDELELLEFSNYLKWNINRKQILKELVFALQVCSLSKIETHQKIASDLLCVLIKFEYTVDFEFDKKALSKICQYLVQYVFQHVLSEFNISRMKGEDNTLKSIFHHIDENEKSASESLSATYTQLLIGFATKNPTFKVSDAVMKQCNWQSYSMPSPLLHAFRKILSSCSFDQVCSVVNKILTRDEINWNSFLTLVSSILVTVKGASQFFEDLSANHLRSGLQDNCNSKLVIGLLLARHCCAEGSQFFITYSTWFEKYFKSGSHNLLVSARHFRFFIKFLTTLVPFEPFRLIKVHVLSPPHPPNPGLRDLLREYKALALTRIDDLKRSTKHNTIERAAVSCEVDEAVKSYGKTSKIPSSVLEMSIFRKSYYLNNFLPVLLSARPLPDVEDSRMKLISHLYKQNKIPKSMHASYESQCAAESVKLVEEIIDLDDEFEDPQCLLARLQEAITSFCSIDQDSDQQNSFAEKGVALCRILNQLIPDPTVIDIDTSNVIDVDCDKTPNDTYAQIVNSIMDCLNLDQPLDYNSLAYFLNALTAFRNLKDAISCHLYTNYKTQIKEINCRFSVAFILLLIGCCANKDWVVQFTPQSHSDPNVKQKAFLLEAILSTTTRSSNSTCFINEAQFYIDVVSQLRLIKNLPSDSNTLTTFQLIYNLLLFYKTRIDQFLREETCFSRISSKKQRLQVSDASTMLNSDLLNQLNCSCSYMQATFKLTQSKEDELVDFVTREMYIKDQYDFLSRRNKQRLYQALLYREGIDLDVFVKIIISFVESSDHISNNELRDFVMKNLLSFLLLNGCSCPSEWLLDIFRSRVNIIESKNPNEISRRLAHKREVLHLTELLLRLPSTFLFSHLQVTTSSRWSQISLKEEDLCKYLASYFNHFLRRFAFEIKTTDDVCSHLINGLIQTVSEDFGSIFNWLSTHVPLLSVFLLVHWANSLDLQWSCKAKCPFLYDSVSSLSNLVSCDNLDNFGSAPETPLHLICLTLLILHDENDMSQIKTRLNCLSNIFSNIFVSFLSCLAAYVAQQTDINETFDVEAYKEVTDHCIIQASTKLDCQILFHPNPDVFLPFSSNISADHYYNLALIRLLAESRSLFKTINGCEFFSESLISCISCHNCSEFSEPKLQSLFFHCVRRAATVTLKAELQKLLIPEDTKAILVAEFKRRRT